MNRIAVLAYHSVNVAGSTYSGNDHVALESDLQTIARMGIRVAPLVELVQDFLAGDLPLVPTVALTFDDGSAYDFYDLEFPAEGLQKAFLTILREFGANPQFQHVIVHATAFVIASPAARSMIDSSRLSGLGRMGDQWWNAAVESGMMGIGNHSWDHVHDCLPRAQIHSDIKGDFTQVSTLAEADTQVRQAFDFIQEKAPNASSRLFAYPYGHVSPYLAQRYFPARANQPDACVDAAFTTQGEYWTVDSSRWELPRFVCGHHWRSPQQLEALLAGLRS